LDPEQVRMMETEEVLIVDENDNVLRAGTKRETHLMSNINNGLLHRAFSVFLFNTKGELLMQQRAREKITFSYYWTNTCCSHPLAIPSEQIQKDQLGVKNAAIRKLAHELGIPTNTFTPQDFVFLTKIHYKAPFDDIWGEHEIDYILIVQKDVVVESVDKNEVCDFNFVSKEKLKELISNPNITITPWFKLIVENFIYKWWDNLSNSRFCYAISPFRSPTIAYVKTLSFSFLLQEQACNYLIF